MKTISINLYTFNELSEQAKQKALENEAYINVENFDWWKSTYEDAERIGLKITSSNWEYKPTAEGKLLLSANEVAANIFKEHGNACGTYSTAELFMKEWQPVFDDYMDEESENYESSESEDKLNEMEENFLNELLNDYAQMLQDEYNYLTSEEAIIETIEANEYTFEQDGTMNNS